MTTAKAGAAVTGCDSAEGIIMMVFIFVLLAFVFGFWAGAALNFTLLTAAKQIKAKKEYERRLIEINMAADRVAKALQKAFP